MESNNLNQNDPQNTENATPNEKSSCSCSSGRFRTIGRAVLIVLVIAAVIAIIAKRDSSSTVTIKGYIETSPIAWTSDYQTALQKAKAQNKPVLLAFHASWCPPCKMMMKTTYANPDIMKRLQDFVPVLIDTDIQQNISNQYNVSELPTYVILRPEGTIAATFRGYYQAADFAAKLETAIK